MRSHLKSRGCSSEILKRTLYLLSCIIFRFNILKGTTKTQTVDHSRLKTPGSPSVWLNAEVEGEGGEGVGGVLPEKLAFYNDHKNSCALIG